MKAEEQNIRKAIEKHVKRFGETIVYAPKMVKRLIRSQTFLVFWDIEVDGAKLVAIVSTNRSNVMGSLIASRESIIRCLVGDD